MKSKNRFVALLLGHKLVAASSALVALAVVGGVLFFTGTMTRIPLFNIGGSTGPITEQPPIDNLEMLEGIGLTVEAIDESPSVGVTQGRCKGDKTYYYDSNGDRLSVTTRQRDGSYICTTYEVNTVKTYVTGNGSQVTEETRANADTGARQTVETTQNTDGTSEVNVEYEVPDGSGMGWGGTGEEQCFGPNNTVCTIVDTGVGQRFIDMLHTCILVSTGDGYWRLGTPADNLSANTITDGSSCANWQNYKNFFYDK